MISIVNGDVVGCKHIYRAQKSRTQLSKLRTGSARPHNDNLLASVIRRFIVLKRVQYLTLEAFLITNQIISNLKHASRFRKSPTVPG